MSNIRIGYWNETLTVYTPYVEDKTRKWRKQTVLNCFWGQTDEKQFADRESYLQNQYFARLPCDTPCAETDCLIVRGGVDDLIPDGSSCNALRSKYIGRSFVVKSIKDNTASPYLKHIRASGG